MKNYYDTLGVDENASDEDIKAAFRKLAAQHHPDKGGSQPKFQEINEAYDTLKNKQKRQEYDAMRRFGGGSNTGQRFNFNSQDFFSDDMFDQFFSGFRGGDMDFGGPFNFRGTTTRAQRPRTNKSVNIRISVSIKEVVQPVEKTLSFKLPSGRNEIVQVKIPAGCQNGATFKYKGLGDDSDNRFARGDLLVNVSVLDCDGFTRKMNDLWTDRTITCFEAIRGTEFKIKTLDDRILKVRVPAGTQPNHVIALKGHGMPVHTSLNVRGNIYVKLHITIPTLNEKQLEKIKDL